MNEYEIIIEETATGFSAYSPDVPGCVATGTTREEVERDFYKAVQLHRELEAEIARDSEPKIKIEGTVEISTPVKGTSLTADSLPTQFSFYPTHNVAA